MQSRLHDSIIDFRTRGNEFRSTSRASHAAPSARLSRPPLPIGHHGASAPLDRRWAPAPPPTRVRPNNSAPTPALWQAVSSNTTDGANLDTSSSTHTRSRGASTPSNSRCAAALPFHVLGQLPPPRCDGRRPRVDLPSAPASWQSTPTGVQDAPRSAARSACPHMQHPREHAPTSHRMCTAGAMQATYGRVRRREMRERADPRHVISRGSCRR